MFIQWLCVIMGVAGSKDRAHFRVAARQCAAIFCVADLIADLKKLDASEGRDTVLCAFDLVSSRFLIHLFVSVSVYVCFFSGTRTE